ncbi:MAG: hypothetical protein GWN53_17325 [Gammaproteobacteria bacterium]|uniref:Uncharacterized protein n=1 Tax=Candidatus Kutchimonas denitrificans TaxID=3056748 RepID=A0AAE4ZCI9_9BACT|nr:hypothetical protein [Candidatus Kutchimonas denitrificans]NIV53604.1 hypothetical protein [Gammaproteobacteria bacterium]
MAWQKTTDLNPLQFGEFGFHDPASGRYAIVLLQEGPTGRGEEKRSFALWWEAREVDSNKDPVLRDGVPVEDAGTWSVRYSRLKRGRWTPDDFEEVVLDSALKALDAQSQAMDIKGRYPLHPKHPNA